jgi:hypothetical protein
LATGVSTVRYLIPQRTFKYVAMVQSVTDETCQLPTHAPQQGCKDNLLGAREQRRWHFETQRPAAGPDDP